MKLIFLGRSYTTESSSFEVSYTSIQGQHLGQKSAGLMGAHAMTEEAATPLTYRGASYIGRR
jgi:hypothetical protein